MEAYQKEQKGALLIITHSTRILESLHVDYTHILVNGRIVKTGDGSLVDEINARGFERLRAGVKEVFPVEEKTYVADIDRTVYDIKDDEKDAYKLQAGLTPEIVQKISDEKNDPAWMQLFPLQSLQVYNEMPGAPVGPAH